MKKGFLALTRTVAGVAAGAVVGAVAVKKLQGLGVDEKDARIDKFKTYYNMLNQWLIIKHDGKSLEKYFIDNNYNTIAIYGMGEIGNRLYEDLQNTSVAVKYAVDQNAAGTYTDLEVQGIEDEFAEVDAIVVTATFAFDEIEEELSKKVDFPIISLEEVVYGI